MGKLTVTAKRRAEWNKLEAQLSGCLRGLEKKGAPRLEHDPVIPESPGIYLFVDGKTPIYVGQSRNLRNRLANHCRPSSGHNSASLAFNMAKCQYKAQHTRKVLPKTRAKIESDADFEQLFTVAKLSLNEMEVRWIEVKPAELRTVLEVYIAVLLGTKYNSFETH